MNRLLRGLLGSIGDISPSKSNAACMELNKKDREHLEHILECIRENKKHSRIANNGIDDKEIERFGKFIIPFDAIGKSFIKEQISRGNADATVKHYEQTIRRISKVECYQAPIHPI